MVGRLLVGRVDIEFKEYKWYIGIFLYIVFFLIDFILKLRKDFFIVN